jgi:hypothetical protein
VCYNIFRTLNKAFHIQGYKYRLGAAIVDDIWVPTGNPELDSIDIKIEQLFFVLRRNEDILSTYELTLAEVVIHLKRIHSQIVLLRENRLVVSMQEYAVLQSEYEKLKKTKGLYFNKVEGLKNEVSNLHKEINKLYKQRNQLIPRVLEFKKHDSKR